jgi:flagellar basal-body rod protein FlgB
MPAGKKLPHAGRALPPRPSFAEIRRFSHGVGNWHAHCIMRWRTAVTGPFHTKDGSSGTKFRGRNGKISMGEDALFGIHGAALQIRSQRMSLLASNIANAATPGYKARDVNFTKALDAATGAMGGSAGVDSAVTDATGYRIPTQSSLNGNTVELPTEQTAFSENAVQYRATLSFLQGRVSQITDALKGE